MARVRLYGKPTTGLSPAFLQRLLAAVGAGGATKLNIISGYRSPEYNASVGGATHSNHTRGLAIDATAFIPGRGWIPAGDVPGLSGYALRSGDQPGFFHNAPDPNHVDAGYMATGVAPMPGTIPNPAPQPPPVTSSFANQLAARTGLFPNVVAAWQQAEGGPASNPLNIGPGRSFADPVGATAAFLTTQDKAGYYKPILSAKTPSAEIAAIKQSPWDAGHYSNGVLDRTWAEHSGGSSAPVPAVPAVPAARGGSKTATAPAPAKPTKPAGPAPVEPLLKFALKLLAS